MEWLYLISQVALVGILVMREIMHYKEDERKDSVIHELELRLISRTPEEYARQKEVEKPVVNMPDLQDPYVPIEDISFDTLNEAKENI